MYKIDPDNSCHYYLEGGGEMGERTRAYDWHNSLLGSPEQWPQGLLNTLNTVLKSKFPMFIWWGPELIQFYNDAYRPSLGNEGKHPAALGQRGEDCWPEIWPVIKPLIDQVMSGGEATWSEDQLIPIYRNNCLEDVYWTFSYTPIIGESGRTGGVLVICHETTEKVKAYIALEQASKDLEAAQTEAVSQRDRLRNFFMQAPAGICILDGPDMVFELINPSYQQLFANRELLNKPLLEALPELREQDIFHILSDVYHNDHVFEGNSVLVPVANLENGPVEDRYFNFIYQPRHNVNGDVDGILVFVFEVTEIANAKNDLEAEKDKLKVALSAAELGTFDINLKDGTMEWDERCRTLFGITHSHQLTFENDFINNLHPDDQCRIIGITNELFSNPLSGGNYDVEYRTVGVEDHKIRWVRAKGKVYFDNNGQPLRCTGSVLDITEQKTDELRKNDFIGMVSHELKTPLTSLKAYVQVLEKKLVDDSVTNDLLSNMNRQVEKMSAMINGFLNVSRLESGKIVLDKVRFDLWELIVNIVEETKLIGSNHTIRLIPSGSVFVDADKEKISAVLTNLLSNAMKYSPLNTTILVKCEKHGGRVHVSVRDEGIGIEQQDIKNLFKRYYRVQAENSKHISGFGIGLYLCYEIIVRHNGRIWVDSKKGEGSTFSFVLPGAA